jgi:hypothetical protein
LRGSLLREIMRRLLFWLECIDKGLAPWRVEAQTVKELEELRVRGAHELEQLLWTLLVQRHGQNVGIESPIAQENIRAGISTTIRISLGRRRFTTFTLLYERHGTCEKLDIRKDGSGFSLRMRISDLSIHEQRNIRQLL